MNTQRFASKVGSRPRSRFKIFGLDGWHGATNDGLYGELAAPCDCSAGFLGPQKPAYVSRTSTFNSLCPQCATTSLTHQAATSRPCAHNQVCRAPIASSPLIHPPSLAPRAGGRHRARARTRGPRPTALHRPILATIADARRRLPASRQPGPAEATSVPTRVVTVPAFIAVPSAGLAGPAARRGGGQTRARDMPVAAAAAGVVPASAAGVCRQAAFRAPAGRQ
jgi:hypothetical protein